MHVNFILFYKVGYFYYSLYKNVYLLRPNTKMGPLNLIMEVGTKLLKWTGN